MKRAAWFFILLTALFVLASVACNLTALTGGSATSTGTAVAATITALPPAVTENVSETSSVSAIPSAAASAATPIRCSFVDSARNLYVWTVGSAAPVKLVDSGDVVESFVSPNGSLVAYTRSADYSAYELDVISADGTNQRTLIGTAAFASMPRPEGSLGLVPNQILWIPNSHRLAMSLRATFEGPGLQIADTLYNVDAESGAITRLIAAGDNFRFSYAPDGAWLVIARPTGVDLYSAVGGLVSADVVKYDFVNTASEYAWVATPAWQADSSRFMVAIPPQEPWVENPAASAVWRVTTTGTAVKIDSSEMGFFPAGIASFDPALTKMTFVRRVGAAADNTWTLHEAHVDGSTDTVIDTGYIGHLPVWSPDGSRFIYAKLVGSTSQAYLVEGDSAPVLLPGVTSLIDVRWLDNSRYLISSRGADGSSLLLGTTGSSDGVLFTDPGKALQQEFSFDVNR